MLCDDWIHSDSVRRAGRVRSLPAFDDGKLHRTNIGTLFFHQEQAWRFAIHAEDNQHAACLIRNEPSKHQTAGCRTNEKMGYRKKIDSQSDPPATPAN